MLFILGCMPCIFNNLIIFIGGCVLLEELFDELKSEVDLVGLLFGLLASGFDLDAAPCALAFEFVGTALESDVELMELLFGLLASEFDLDAAPCALVFEYVGTGLDLGSEAFVVVVA